jgi:hypothetical protein
MTKVFRFVAMCTIGIALATFSIASAQTYTTIDFPGAVATTLNGGPNPQGTSVGSYTDTSNVTHGFTLTKKDVFTSFDPPGSTLTTPNFISPQGVIVGAYNDSSIVSHGFILKGGNTQQWTSRVQLVPLLRVSTPRARCPDFPVPTLPAALRATLPLTTAL